MGLYIFDTELQSGFPAPLRVYSLLAVSSEVGCHIRV